MGAKKLAGLLLCLSFLTPSLRAKERKWLLPPGARITMRSPHLIENYPKDDCPYLPLLTRRELRRMFRTYHEVTDVEHEGYMEMGCVTEGDIFVNGKKFYYVSQPVNNLWTNWPDGKERRLGGKNVYEDGTVE